MVMSVGFDNLKFFGQFSHPVSSSFLWVALVIMPMMIWVAKRLFPPPPPLVAGFNSILFHNSPSFLSFSGDSLYPDKPDVIGEHCQPTATGTYKTRRELDKSLNRFEFGTLTLVSNQSTLNLNRTPPIDINDLKELFPHMQSKL
jgi:hypothetical protein